MGQPDETPDLSGGYGPGEVGCLLLRFSFGLPAGVAYALRATLTDFLRIGPTDRVVLNSVHALAQSFLTDGRSEPFAAGAFANPEINELMRR
jgi:hypothetical protein